MRYTICTIRPAVAPATDDGLLYPVPGAEPDSIGLERRDGSSIRQLFAREISVGPAASREPILRADDIRARVYVTDSRVAVACTKYDKGGGWIGGPIALTLNIVSRTQAAQRRRGKTLVGHVRYPWLCGVYAGQARRWGGSELLRLVVDGEGGRLHLDLVLPRGADAPAVAVDVLRRAARFRLEYDEDATADQRAELETLARLESLRPATSDDLAGCDLPTSLAAHLAERATRNARAAVWGRGAGAARHPRTPRPGGCTVAGRRRDGRAAPAEHRARRRHRHHAARPAQHMT